MSSSLFEVGPPKLTADASKLKPPNVDSRIFKDIIALRKGIGGLKAVKAVAKPGEKTVPFAVKSAAVLMSKFRKGLDKLNMLCYPVHTEYSLIPKEKGAIAYAVYTVRFVSSDGSYIDVVSTSEGADTQDKAAGKCMTYGWKFAVIYTLCLPDADIKEDWGEEPLEDSDSAFEPTDEKDGISAVSPASYVERVCKASGLDEYNAIVTEMRANLTLAQQKTILKTFQDAKKNIEDSIKVKESATIGSGNNTTETD